MFTLALEKPAQKFGLDAVWYNKLLHLRIARERESSFTRRLPEPKSGSQVWDLL